jgi:hypothetical protein
MIGNYFWNKKGTQMKKFTAMIDTPPNPLMDSTVSLKVKTTKREGVGVRSLARNTLRVKGMLLRDRD